jgi:hypothetical protein
MTVPQPSRVHVLVLRAWVEEAHPSVLRVRILELDGAGEQTRPLAVVDDADQACAVVRAWLQRLEAGRSSP